MTFSAHLYFVCLLYSSLVRRVRFLTIIKSSYKSDLPLVLVDQIIESLVHYSERIIYTTCNRNGRGKVESLLSQSMSFLLMALVFSSETSVTVTILKSTWSCHPSMSTSWSWCQRYLVSKHHDDELEQIYTLSLLIHALLSGTFFARLIPMII